MGKSIAVIGIETDEAQQLINTIPQAVRLVVDPTRVERRDLAGDRGHETDAEGSQAQHRQEAQQCEEAKLPDPAAALGPRHGGTSSAQQNCGIVTALKS